VCGAAALNWQKLLLYESKALSAGAQQYNGQIIINLDVVVNQSRFKAPFGRPIQLGFLLAWVPVRGTSLCPPMPNLLLSLGWTAVFA
jgi:hypothetical protein